MNWRYFAAYSLITLVFLIIAELSLSVLYFQKREDGLALVYSSKRLASKMSAIVSHESVPPSYARIIDTPAELIEELRQHKAVVDDAYNPTGTKKHDTILVTPDETLKYRLRPNVQLDAYSITPENSNNFNPPTVYINQSTPISPELKAYLEKKTRLVFSITTNEQAVRTTMPNVSAKKKVLFVGDSVTFGVGVADEHTSASYLQRMVGDNYQVINAGIGGYNGEQALTMAKIQAEDNNFDALVYIACQNDFRNPETGQYNHNMALNVFEKFSQLKQAFGGNVLVVLQTYMMYNMRDVFDGLQGWNETQSSQTDILRNGIHNGVNKIDVRYIDFTDSVAESRMHKRTLFAPTALYVDHAHFSPEGNELMASVIYNQLNDMGLHF